MATASATLNNPLGTSNNALTTSDGSSTGTSMVASGTPLRSNDVARSVANTALSDPMGMVRDLVRQPTVKKALPTSADNPVAFGT